MLIPHTFRPDLHLYEVENSYVLSTSAIKSLNGLDDVSCVPMGTLEAAREKGCALDEAICELEKLISETGEMSEDDLEQGALPDFLYFDLRMYLRFREQYSMRFIDCQRSMVYQHEIVDQLIGVTPDLRCMLGPVPFVLDVKRRYPTSGQAKKRQLLSYRLQLQSQKEATGMDEEFWSKADTKESLRKAILHIHPKLKNGFEFITEPFEKDDSRLWASFVEVASEKMASGFTQYTK